MSERYHYAYKKNAFILSKTKSLMQHVTKLYDLTYYELLISNQCEDELQKKPLNECRIKTNFIERRFSEVHLCQ